MSLNPPKKLSTLEKKEVIADYLEIALKIASRIIKNSDTNKDNIDKNVKKNY